MTDNRAVMIARILTEMDTGNPGEKPLWPTLKVISAALNKAYDAGFQAGFMANNEHREQIDNLIGRILE
jgi:hypothetical protein